MTREVPSLITTVQKWLFVQDIFNLRLIVEGKTENTVGSPRLRQLSCSLGGHSKLAREENKAHIASCNSS